MVAAALETLDSVRTRLTGCAALVVEVLAMVCHDIVEGS